MMNFGELDSTPEFNPIIIEETAKCRQKETIKYYYCKVCMASFKSWTGRYYHMAKHTGQYKYFCDVCDKGFMKKDVFFKHKVVHSRQIENIKV